MPSTPQQRGKGPGNYENGCTPQNSDGEDWHPTGIIRASSRNKLQDGYGDNSHEGAFSSVSP
jgi:hypothetical protein|tara:strand:+ start:416 stop:601 length:186 start_codon:yes stop_codon:yes gene_type:complete